MSAALLFAAGYAVSLLARRIEQMLAAGDELQWRAGGTRRAFRLIDWTPSP